MRKLIKCGKPVVNTKIREKSTENKTQSEIKIKSVRKK